MLNHNKTNSGHKKTTKYEIHVEQMSETKLKAQELEEKQYTKEQVPLCCCLVGFRKPPQKITKVLPSDNLSPRRKIQLQSELINQVSKWHDLLQAGVISQSDYEELHKSIFNDIKTFSELHKKKPSLICTRLSTSTLVYMSHHFNLH